MTFGQQAKLAGIMSLPAIMAQLSSVLMQFIDSAMVGNLGVNAAASVGLMSTCTWMFGGFCSAAAAGFSGGPPYRRERFPWSTQDSQARHYRPADIQHNNIIDRHQHQPGIAGMAGRCRGDTSRCRNVFHDSHGGTAGPPVRIFRRRNAAEQRQHEDSQHDEYRNVRSGRLLQLHAHLSVENIDIVRHGDFHPGRRHGRGRRGIGNSAGRMHHCRDIDVLYPLPFQGIAYHRTR